MAISVTDSRQQWGKLVALEGNPEVITTQLHLLPPSEKVLVLPSLTESLPKVTEQQGFDARSFVREVYTAYAGQTELAWSFLESSTQNHPRLVFLNGGSVCARTACIAAIYQNVTNGDVYEAESIFNGIVADGVTRLMRQVDTESEGLQMESDPQDDKEDDTEIIEDLTTASIKATGALDCEHAGSESDEGVIKSVNSEGLEMYPDASVITDVEMPVESVSLTSTTSQRPSSKSSVGVPEDEIITTVLTLQGPKSSPSILERHDHLSMQDTISQDFNNYSSQSGYSTTPGYQSENDNEDHCDAYSDVCMSMPATPPVEYGEACIVDIQNTSPGYHMQISSKYGCRRAKSFEKLYQGEWVARGHAQIHSAKLRQTASAVDLKSLHQTLATSQKDSEENYGNLPRKTFSRASETTIRKPSVGTNSEFSQQRSRSTSRTFVDRGTDAEDILTGTVDEVSVEHAIEDSLELPFALVEDLVIHFNDHESLEIFESVLRSYKIGRYSMLLQADPDDQKNSRRSFLSPPDEIYFRPTSVQTTMSDDVKPEKEGIGRYSTDNHIKYEGQQPLRMQQMPPPTPRMSPTRPIHQTSEKFVSFSPVDTANAIRTQNALREILALHFPGGENGFSQRYFSLSPESERMWKPVFRSDDGGSFAAEGQTVDQIIAIGCEVGVKREFFNQISGRIEKVGTKRNGTNNSAKIDIRYLIANVMQSHSTLRLHPQSVFNPLSDPELLATLLIPQLEAYLASNVSTRLLVLQYSSNHLATVLALRDLLGSDLLKVAGILDTLASDPPSMTTSRRSSSRPGLRNIFSSSNTVSSRSNSAPTGLAPRPLLGQALHKSYPCSSDKCLTQYWEDSSMASSQPSVNILPDVATAPSFSKADYLLPSMATDAEITSFLADIWKPLVSKSTFYIPEPETEPAVIEKIVEKVVQIPPDLGLMSPLLTPTNLTPASSPFGNRDNREQSYPFRHTGHQSKISRLTGALKPSYAPSTTSTKQNYAASIASSMTGGTGLSRQRSLKGWENFYVGEEDSDDDDFDKMILGRGYAKIRPETPKAPGYRRPTKKALKWLGLA